jgi:heat shock protein HslJ
MKRRVILATTLLVLTATLLAGCGSSSAQKSSGGNLGASDWKVTTMNFSPYNGTSTITSKFSNGTITGSTGINMYRGTYKTGSGSSITIKIGPTSKMTGTPEQMQAESEFLQALASAAKYAADENSLTLFGADGMTVLTYKPNVAAKMTGTTWTMTQYGDGKGGLLSTGSDSAVTLTFNPNGTLTGAAALAGFQGKYTLSGSNITITSLMLTKQTGAPNLLMQSGQFLNALKSASTYSITGSELTLRNSQGTTVVVCQAP